MPREIPPFGGTDDADIENALQWFLGFLNADDWKTRVAAIERNIESGMQPRTRDFDTGDYVSAYGGRDRMAWYLYLVHTALHDPLKYEPNQGARILPIFKRLGADLGLLKRIGGVEERVQRLLGGERAQPDGGLFELLVALLWKRNGYPTVEFIPERPPGKSPDILARSGREEWFVECKRLRKSSEYSEREREKWLAMWSRFAQHLTRHNISLVFEMTFHVELASLPDDYLVAQLAGKLPFLSFPCHIASNETWDVTARPVDYHRARAHLRRYRVRVPSDQIQELLAGYRDPRRGFTSATAGDVVRIGGASGNNRFLDSLSFAACSFWSCDAPRAVLHKARDVRRHLARAVDQLPSTGKCAVHLGLETLDGPLVEQVRFDRTKHSIDNFHTLGKDLRWVYCHLFESYAPPDQCWVMDETVTHFGKSLTGRDEPLAFRPVIVSDDETAADGVHWDRDPP
ncbi:MAG: hypothetical protein OXC01_21880 [Immundisolibacterales bacterium]|nr:hypothetical protein [Immundisolibacterales bacterium]